MGRVAEGTVYGRLRPPNYKAFRWRLKGMEDGVDSVFEDICRTTGLTGTDASTSRLIEMSKKKGEEILSARLEKVSLSARKLFDVIVQQAYRGPLRPKVKGIATPAEILEACGLDVGEFYVLLESLAEAGLIQVLTPYPFEEVHITPEAAEALLMAGLVTEKPR